MNIIAAITLPIIAGCIGWFTNYLAVKMLFYPRKPKVILGLTIQGIFPKRQAFVAEKVGHLVAEELLATEEIFNRINSEKNLAMLKHKLNEKLGSYFELTLVRKYPMIAKLLPEKLKNRIKEEILEEVENQIPSLLRSQVGYLEENLDLRGIIRSKVNMLSSEKLEKIIWDILAEEFKFIEWIGAILGFTIGLVQVLIAFIFF